MHEKEQVLDHIVEFICNELAEIQAEKEAEEMSDGFSDILKITPAPTCPGTNPLASNNLYHNIETTDTDSPAKSDNKRPKEWERETERSPPQHVGRNKLGTVFNERIIVSPVPFVATTRESFTTIRRTPIQFMGENPDFPNNARSGE